MLLHKCKFNQNFAFFPMSSGKYCHRWASESGFAKQKFVSYRNKLSFSKKCWHVSQNHLFKPTSLLLLYQKKHGSSHHCYSFYKILAKFQSFAIFMVQITCTKKRKKKSSLSPDQNLPGENRRKNNLTLSICCSPSLFPSCYPSMSIPLQEAVAGEMQSVLKDISE